MSIASEISRLSGVRENIFTSITNKGVTVPATATFSSCPALIDSITGGGSGPATSMINPTFTASGFLSGYRPFTATQKVVPLYDNVSGTYISGSFENIFFIQVPLSALSSADFLTDYMLRFSTQSWNIDNTQIIIFPNSSYPYQDQYYTTASTTDFSIDTIYTPPLYFYDFSQSDFINFWSEIQRYPWIATAFTGEYVYIGCQGYQQYQNMKGEWSYHEQTGTDVPYPTYPSTTTGYITNEISGVESFTGTTNKVPNIYVSGFRNAVYDNSPEGGANPIIPSNIDLTSFNTNMLKNNIAAIGYYTLDSTAYSYSYGSVNSAYSGFEGV